MAMMHITKGSSLHRKVSQEKDNQEVLEKQRATIKELLEDHQGLLHRVQILEIKRTTDQPQAPACQDDGEAPPRMVCKNAMTGNVH
jgi:uncharacterized membrane protein YgaE (UPF0421/DUF939 family)